MADQPTPDERRFRALASSSVERIAELDSRGRTVYISPNHATEGDDVLASLDHVHPDDRAEVAARFADAFRGNAGRVSFRVHDLKGATRWVESTVTPFPAEDGERHVLVVSRDVSEARELEQQLRESRERFQLIAENAYDMIVEYDGQWRLQYANDRVHKVLGFAEPERDFDRRFVHPDDRTRVAAMFASVRDGREESAHSTYRVRRADGSWCWIDGSLRAFAQRDGQRNFLIIARDVSARVEAERRVRESERRYRELVENAPLGIFVVQGVDVVFANAAAAALYGAPNPEALCSRSMLELLDEEGARAVAHLMARRSGTGDPSASTFAIHLAGSDGEERHLTGVGTVISYAGAPAFQCIVSDVTELERSRREQERLALQLQEARKLESLGVLAGGIAHDFNNLLAVILSSVRYARSPDAAPGDRTEALGDAEEATESAARLVKQLLAYAGRRSPEVRSVDLSELARSLSELLSTALPGGVELSLDLERAPLQVHADLVQLEQVLMNLVLNAADAVGSGPGTVTVRTTHETFEPGELARWIAGEDLAGGSYACLEVEDSGVGMDAETRARIFEPFFSTKQDGHGLGLSAVLGLVQGHRGAIEVRSEPGAGTCIRVALPADPVPVHRRRSGAVLVLVAEPDPAVRRSAIEALRAVGNEVVEAADVARGLDLWALHGEELDAAVIDTALITPGGQQLVRALHADRPELPILALCSADDAAIAEREPGIAFVSVPFTPHALRESLAAQLAKRDAATPR